MATDIEQRVVQMRFDNAQFEKGIKQSYESLDQFEKKLDMKGAAKGLENVQKAADQVNLDNLVAQTDKVGGKFDTMAVIAISALNRITNAAITMGSQMVKSLTIAPISTGFNEYELKLNSIQTILANTKRHGTTLEDVGAALDDLNHYADKTIYNFGQMTKSIGMFTAAGVELEPAKEAIKGISNLAAYVGAPAQDASRAMYQLSQGLATGYINLRDWMSLENTAGMSGMEFQTRLKDTARVMGKNVDAMIAKNGSFRESLKEGWLTSEVLIETLKQFAGEVDATYLKQQGWTDAQIESILELGRTATESATVVKSFTQLIDTLRESAQSGWAESWEIIIGSLDEAKKLWTNVNNVIGGILEEQARQRNEMLQEWADLGGRTVAIDAISRAFNNLLSIIDAVHEAFIDIFPPMTGKQLKALTDEVYEFFNALTPSKEALNTIRVAVKGLLLPFKMLTTGIQIVIAVFKELVIIGAKLIDKMLAWPSKFSTIEDALKDLFGDERGHRLAEALTKIVNGLTDAFTRLTKSSDDASESLGSKIFSRLVDIFTKLTKVLGEAGGWVLDRLIDGLEFIANLDFSPFIEFMKGVGKSVMDFASNLDFTGPIEFFKSLWDAAGKLVERLQQVASGLDLVAWAADYGPVGEQLQNIFLGLADAIKTLIGKLTPAKILVFGFGATLVTVFFNLSKAIEAFTSIAKGIAGVMGGINGLIKAVTQRIKGSKILQVAVVIATLAGALMLLSSIPADRLLAASGALAIVMGSLLLFTAGMTIINDQLVKSPETAKNLYIIAGALAAVGGAAVLIAASLKVLSTVDISQIGWQLLAFAGALTIMVGAMAAVGKLTKGAEKTSLYILAFSASILMLTHALEKVSNIDISGGIGNLMVLITALGALSLVARLASGVKVTSMLGLTLFIGNLFIFAGALILLQKFDTGKLLRGVVNLIPVFAAITALALAVRIAGGKAGKMGTQLLMMSGAIMVLSVAIEKIGSLDQGVIERGSRVVEEILLIFGGIVVLSAVAERGAKAGTSFIMMSVAILILGAAIENIGKLDPQVAKQGTIVVGALLVLFGIINATGNAANGAKASIIAMSVCLGLLVASLAILTLLDFNELMGRALALGTVMGAFGVMLKGAEKLKMSAALGAILELITVISLLALAFKYLDGIDPKATLASAIGMGIVLVALNSSFSMVKIRTGDGGNLLKTIGTMGLILAEVALVFGLLQKLGQGEQPIQNAIAIGIILEAVSDSFNRIRVRTGDGKNLLKTIGTLGLLLAEVAVIFGLLQNFGQGEQPIQNAIAVGALLEALALASRVMQGVKPPENIGATLLVLGGMLAEATVVIAILNAIPLEDGLIEKVVALGILMGVMTGVIAGISAVGMGLSMLGTVAGQAIIGMGAALVMVTEMMAFIALIGLAFENIGFLKDGLATAEEVFPRIGACIGGFFGGAIAGFLESGLGKAIEDFGTNLSNFATNAAGFLEMKVDSELVDSIGRLASVVLTLAAADFLEAINIFSSGSALENFGKELSLFAPYFAEFAGSLNQVPTDNVKAAADLMESVANVLAAMPTEGGLMGMIFGDKKLDQFGEGLQKIALGVALYATALNTANITEATLAASQTVTDILADLCETIPNSGGLVDFLGRPNLETFGTELVAFATGLSDAMAIFQEANLDEALAKKVKTVGEILASLTKSIPASGTLVDFLGRPNLETFGTELVGFANGMKGFFDVMKDVVIDEDKAKSAKIAGETLAELAQVIPSTGVLIDFLGGKDLGEFGDQIKGYGEGLAAFFKALGESGISEEAVNLSKTAGLAFVEISNALDPNTGISTWWESVDLGKFGEGITALGTSLSDYYTSISGVDWGSVASSTAELSKFADLADTLADIEAGSAFVLKTFLTNLANSGAENFATAFKEFQTDIATAISTTIGGAISSVRTQMTQSLEQYGFVADIIAMAIDTKRDLIHAKAIIIVDAIRSGVIEQQANIENIGSTMMWAIAQAFQRDEVELKDAVRKVLDSVIFQAKQTLDVIGTTSKEFYDIGTYCINGFVQGFEKNAPNMYSRIKNAGDKVVKTFSDATGVNSPSVKFAEIAKFSVLGFVNGINDNTHLGIDAMVKMGGSLLQSIKDFFEIRSPSRVTRDEVGRYIMEGIAEGITEDMSAEEAAAQKARNIVDAFRTEFDKLSTSFETLDLEEQLWRAMNPYAGEEELKQRDSAMLEKKLQYQANRVSMANAQYQATLQAMGATAEETKQAYNEYLKEKISFAEMAGERVSELEEKRMESIDQFKAYSDFIQQYADEYRKLGYSDDDIKSLATEASGWTKTLKVDSIEDIMQEYVKAAQGGSEEVQVVIVEETKKAVEETIETAGQGGVKTGQSYVQGVKDGITGGGSSGNGGLTEVFKNGMDAVKNNTGSMWEQIGAGQIEGLINGANSGMGDFGETMVNGVEKAGNWVREKLGINSPSRYYAEIGANCVAGLAQGLGDPSQTAQMFAINERNCNQLLDTFSGTTPQYRNVGAQMMAGLSNGISSGGSAVVNAAAAVARQAIAATEAILGIKSPSREYYRIGKMIDQGLSNGILDNYEIVKGSLVKISDDMSDVDMSLRPVVDSSSIDAAYKSANRLGNQLDDIDRSSDIFAAWGQTIRFDPSGTVIPDGFSDASSGGTSRFVVVDPETKKMINDLLRNAEYLDDEWKIQGPARYKNEFLNELLTDLYEASVPGKNPTHAMIQEAPPALHFTQNNYSPVHLNASEINRNSKTLLSGFKNEVTEFLKDDGQRTKPARRS